DHLNAIGEIRDRALNLEEDAEELLADLTLVLAAGRQLGDARKPFLELVVEAVMRVARLQIEKAEDERSAKSHERCRKGGAHAAQGSGKTCLQLLEHEHAVGAFGVQRIDRVANGVDRVEQAPERAEQPKEDQKTDQIAARIARLVEPTAD